MVGIEDFDIGSSFPTKITGRRNCFLELDESSKNRSLSIMFLSIVDVPVDNDVQYRPIIDHSPDQKTSDCGFSTGTCQRLQKGETPQ